MSDEGQPANPPDNGIPDYPEEVESLSIRVLLVEDDPSDQDRVREMLERSEGVKFEIEHSAEVEHALGMLQEGGFDVVLLDLTLPEGDGLDTLARAKVAAENVPIIAMASNEDDAQAARVVRMGAQECLIKDRIEPRNLVRTLRHAVERHLLLDQLRIARRREHHMATHDSLTGLPNRYALEEHLKRALAVADRSGGQVAVLFLDLDRFKNINDTKGHPMGDNLLRRTAERLAKLTRKSDMIARFGGDEFIFMLQNVNKDRAPAMLADRILETISAPYELEGSHYRVTGSIGIAISPRDGSSSVALVRSADTAMYRAKSAGGNCYQLYDRSMNEVIEKRFTLECRLRDALENEALQVYFQPKVSFEDGRIVGSEALLRWNDPALGEVPPADFIPIAEETNLVSQLGDLALRKACAQTKLWRDAGFTRLDVSVNVSAFQLSRQGLHESIVDTLWETGLDPQCLELELTESALMCDEDEALDVLREIARMGIRIALDDFGTGFSSLSYLKTIPISTVKIDQSFVRHVVTDADDAAIIQAILSIAEKLDLRVVAEGVETDRQHAVLKQFGCHEFQGFLFAPALPAESFLELLQREKASRQDTETAD